MTRQKLSAKTIVIMLILFIGLVFIDQLTKFLASLDGGCDITIIKDFFSFRYTTNSGASFSMLSNVDGAIYILIAISLLASIGFFIYTFFIPEDNWLYRIIIILIAAGAFANLIDRVIMLEVRDFLYFPWFANCNVADAYVVVGAIMFACYLIFWDKESIVKIIKKEIAEKKLKETTNAELPEENKTDDINKDNNESKNG